MAREEKRRRVSPLVVGGIAAGVAGVAAAAIYVLARAAPPTPPPGRANLYGKVTDAVTGQAIANVLVTLDGMSTYTDSGGNYTFEDIEPGS